MSKAIPTHPFAKTSFLIIIFSVVSISVFSEGWIRSIDLTKIGPNPSFRNYSEEIIKTADNNFLVVGYYMDFFVNNPNKLSIGFMVKYNSSGQTLWVKDFDPLYENRLFSVNNCADGGIVAVGTVDSTATDSTADLYVTKLDASGNLLWESILGTNYEEEQIVNTNKFRGYIHETQDGGFITGSGVRRSSFPYRKHVKAYKLDSLGNEVWGYTFDSVDCYLNHIFPASDDGCFLVIATDGNWYAHKLILKLDKNGNEQWRKEIKQDIFQISSKPNNSFAALAIHFNVPPASKRYILNFDSLFNITDTLYNPDLDSLGSNYSIIQESNFTIDPNGHYVITGWINKNMGFDNRDLGILKIDANGNTQYFTHNEVSLKTSGSPLIDTYADDSCTFLTGLDDHTINNAKTYFFLSKLDANGILGNNNLEGFIYEIADTNCVFDSTENGLEGWIVELHDGFFNYYSTTDSTGYFSFQVVSDTYKLSTYYPSPFWINACNSPDTIIVNQSFDSLYIGKTTLFDCPYMTVDIGTPFLRRCFSSVYTVNYCNYGTVDEYNAVVSVTLDSFLHVDSASIPWNIPQTGFDYEFELDTVKAAECGSFKIYVTVDCDSTFLGQTHCVSAHIYPDTQCLAGIIDSVNLFISALCDDDSIQFTIQNIGTGDMQNKQTAHLIEDDILSRNVDFQLGSGELIQIGTDANGSTYRIFTQYANQQGGLNYATAFIEGCGIDSLGNFHSGFANLLPNTSFDEFLDIDCQQNRGAFDPNDKQGFPEGITDRHFISKEYPIEYKIRFQNTGTDTAFKVIIRDTLSPHLDVTSFLAGSSSHPYTYTIQGQGIIVFTFNDIYLPDSNVDLSGSNGFVNFTITPKQDLDTGSVIYNDASIYFDFNAPVKTNTTWHTIGELGITHLVFIDFNTGIESSEFTKDFQMNVYPNPFTTEATIEITSDENIHDLRLNIYNLSGQLLREEHFSGQDQITIRKEDLNAGVYLISLEINNSHIETARMVVY